VPRFLFHLCKGSLSLSAVAEELPGTLTAISSARGMGRELLADFEGGWSSAHIEVTDEHGDTVGIIYMSDYWLQ
jgi:hypothetical protein